MAVSEDALKERFVNRPVVVSMKFHEVIMVMDAIKAYWDQLAAEGAKLTAEVQKLCRKTSSKDLDLTKIPEELKVAGMKLSYVTSALRSAYESMQLVLKLEGEAASNELGVDLTELDSSEIDMTNRGGEENA